MGYYVNAHGRQRGFGGNAAYGVQVGHYGQDAQTFQGGNVGQVGPDDLSQQPTTGLMD